MGLVLREHISAGNVTIRTVDDSVRRILTPMFAAKLFDVPNKNTTANNVTSEAHNRIVRGEALPLSTKPRSPPALVGSIMKHVNAS